MDPAASNYRPLAQRVRESGVDRVYWAGAAETTGGTLFSNRAGADVKLMGPDGINNDGFFAAAGSAAEGTYATFPGLLPVQLTGTGADWNQR
jgi:hypothetical protein